MHGFALNVNPDLAAFSKIIPCGISDADVSSMSTELHKDLTITDVLPTVEREITRALERVM